MKNKFSSEQRINENLSNAKNGCTIIGGEIFEKNCNFKDKNFTNGYQNGLNDHNEPNATTVITVADLIGEFGNFQLSLALLAFVRYICAGIMTNTGSLLAPELEFRCAHLEGEESIGNCLSNCSKWAYKINGEFQSDQFTSLTDSFDLICERDWLRSANQSCVTVGVVLASVLWGSFSDRHGRQITIKICFLFSLLSGLISFLAQDYFVFTFARAFCSLGDLGLAVTLVTVMVETLGNKYRGAACIFAYSGWAIGVMITPWLTELMYLKSFILFTLICHLLTLPWILFGVRESVRWLLVNGFFLEAKREIERISWWNNFKFRTDKAALLEDEFDLKKSHFMREKFFSIIQENHLNNKKEEAETVAHLDTTLSKFKAASMSILGSFSKVNELIKSKELLIAAATMIWITFICELFYMTTILINSDIGTSIKLNYFIGGVMEILAAIVAIYLIEKLTRKLTIIGILLTISAFCFALALTHQEPQASVYVLNLTKFAVSALTSVVYVTTTELFPTNLRQTGFGLTDTLGGLGSIVSPFIRTELVKLIGLTQVLLILSALPMSACLVIPFFLKETKGVELSDDLDGSEALTARTIVSSNGRDKFGRSKELEIISKSAPSIQRSKSSPVTTV